MGSSGKTPSSGDWQANAANCAASPATPPPNDKKGKCRKACKMNSQGTKKVRTLKYIAIAAAVIGGFYVLYELGIFQKLGGLVKGETGETGEPSKE